MKLVNTDSYAIHDYHFKPGDSAPKAGIIKVDMRHIPEFFRICKGSNKYVVVTSKDDLSICYSNDYPFVEDFVDFTRLNYEFFVNCIRKTDGRETMQFGPRCIVEDCNPDDTHSIRTNNWTFQTFNLDIPENVISWFSTNANIKHNKLVNIPFGTNDGPGFEVPLYGALRKKDEKEMRAYVNFSAHTLPRREIMEEFYPKEWVTLFNKDPNEDGIPHEQFLSDINNHWFIFCPPGVGLDSFRVYEALYFGSMPVVQKGHWNQFLQKLPVIFVETFKKLTLPDLVLAWQDIVSHEGFMDFKIISEEYWQGRIRDDAATF